MSADNGIYILKTAEGEHRVREMFAVDNLNWSFLDFHMDHEFVPTRLVLYFGNVKVRDEVDALKYAADLSQEIYTEYGINILRDNRTWNEIVEQAKKLAPAEIESIENSQDEIWGRELTELREIIA